MERETESKQRQTDGTETEKDRDRVVGRQRRRHTEREIVEERKMLGDQNPELTDGQNKHMCRLMYVCGD